LDRGFQSATGQQASVRENAHAFNRREPAAVGMCGRPPLRTHRLTSANEIGGARAILNRERQGRPAGLSWLARAIWLAVTDSSTSDRNPAEDRHAADATATIPARGRSWGS